MRVTCSKITPLVAMGLLLFSASCNYVTYSPRSKKQVQQEKPSVVLLNRIIEFREEFNSWPLSKVDYMYKAEKYRESFAGFPYAQTEFKLIDNNTMIFYFHEHIKDTRNYQQTGKIDLNSYGGEVKFYKEKDTFIWKLKMY